MAAHDAPALRDRSADAALAARADAVWARGAFEEPALDARQPATPHRILPDGCADVILAFDALGAAPHGPLRLADAWAVGPMTTAHLVPARAHAAYVGVRLRPEHAGAVLGLAAHALVDARVPLPSLWPEAEGLLRGLVRVRDLATARHRLGHALAPRLQRAEAPPAAVAHAVRLLTASGGRLSVAAVGDTLGLTRQHLARLFARHVGLTPKTFARVARLRALLAAVDAPWGAPAATPVGWSALAHAHGFADQAHLVDEVRALTGLTPTAWLRERRATQVPILQDAARARG